MITIEPRADSILKVVVAGTLTEADFLSLSAQVAPLFKKYPHVQLLIDATHFNGWADTHVVAKHFAFVRDHQKKVERIALVAGHAWQHWIAGVASVFVHPEIKTFDKLPLAEQWLLKQHNAA